MDLVQKITERIAELKDMRVKYLTEAEKNLAAYDTAISELESLLKPEEEHAQS